MLSLDLSEIFSYIVDVLVVLLNDFRMMSELSIVFWDKGIKVIFHSFNLYGELLNLTFEKSVLVFFFEVLLFGWSDFDMELFSFVKKGSSFLFKLKSLLLKIVKDYLLFLCQTFINLALLGLYTVNLRKLIFFVTDLFFKIRRNFLFIIFWNLESMNQELLFSWVNIFDVLVFCFSLGNFILE